MGQGAAHRGPPKRNQLPAGFWRRPTQLAACGFGAGAAPFAPGTAGTAVAVPIYLMLRLLEWPGYLLAVLALFVVGVWLCHVTARNFGVHDHSGIVWDEFVGYFITMIAAPPHWGWLVAGFCLFRFFDVAKPWPIRWIDRRVGGGFGIMLDDVLAGFYGLLVIQIAARVI